MTFSLKGGVADVGGVAYPEAKVRSEDLVLGGSGTLAGPAYWARGFHLELDSGYTISAQWGIGNYCANRDTLVPGAGRPEDRDVCIDAEVAVFPTEGDGGLMQLHGDTVQGWVTPEQFNAWVEDAKGWPSPGELERVPTWEGSEDTVLKAPSHPKQFPGVPGR